MDRIMEIADKHGLAVIEDNAQCFLSTYKGNLAGTMGHISSWSFENSKHMSCGEGGIITTNNEEYAQMARKVAGHGYKNLGASYGQIKLNQSVYQDPHYKTKLAGTTGCQNLMLQLHLRSWRIWSKK